MAGGRARALAGRRRKGLAAVARLGDPCAANVASKPGRSAVLTPAELAPQREDFFERGHHQRLLVVGLLGREVRHVVRIARETRRLRLEPLELEVTEVDADVGG